MNEEHSASPPSPWFASALLVVAGGFWWFSGDIPAAALSGEHDPGPRALPVLLSGLLAVGAAIELLRAASWHFTGRNATPTPERGRFRELLILVGGLACYLLIIPRLGFYVSTSLFTCLFSLWLGARLFSALLSSLLIVSVVYLLFGLVFKVQL